MATEQCRQGTAVVESTTALFDLNGSNASQQTGQFQSGGISSWETHIQNGYKENGGMDPGQEHLDTLTELVR